MRIRLLILGLLLLAAAGAPARALDQRRPDSLADALAALASAADPRVIGLAVHAMQCAQATHQAHAARLAVIDYSLPSTETRLWVFDVELRKLLYAERVAHGKGSGDDRTTRFSNTPGSLQSSLGLFRTADTYVGRNGYSLRLDGLDRGYNDRARERAVVMHGAPYVSDASVRSLGRLGRSWGCPAVRSEVARQLLDELRDGQYLFSYYPDAAWLKDSQWLSCPAMSHLAAR